jgi:hypothetical protein
LSLEKQTKDAVKKMLKSVNADVYEIMPATGYGGKIGIPDHLACMPVVITADMVGQTYGMFIAVESKKPKGELHGLQPLNIAKIIKSSGFAQVAQGKDDVPRVEAAIRERFKLCKLKTN